MQLYVLAVPLVGMTIHPNFCRTTAVSGLLIQCDSFMRDSKVICEMLVSHNHAETALSGNSSF